MQCRYFVSTILCLAAILASQASAVPAFPGAEGYGAAATGGRGGAVYEVTNLNDSGTGSFRAAIMHSGARTVVFRVSGTIYLLSALATTYDNLTIAGQTAPGDGITIAGDWLEVNSNNVIIRYIRCRLGDIRSNGTQTDDTDSIGGRFKDKIIIDHVTASWSIDEACSFYVNTNVTVQWCLISESLYASHHAKGNHGYGGIWGSTNSSWHHNLMAHHSSRNPRIDGEITNNCDLRNNVIYNWGYNSCYGGEQATVNIVNCYYKYGPATGSDVRDRIAQPSLTTDSSGVVLVPHQYGKWYITGNYVDGYPAVTANNWAGGVDPDGGSSELSLCKSTTEFPGSTTYPVTTQTAQTAYSYVLASAGCSLVRDSIDKRIITEVKNRTATYGGTYGANKGIIDSQTTVGGWPTLNSTTAPTDSDHDGMPDAWETAHGLSPTNASDRNGDRNGDGYTNLEEYINSLCQDPYGLDITPPTPNPITWSIMPWAISGDTITMTATTATDPSGVEYRFVCSYGTGPWSAWQDSSSYTASSLAPGTYAYTAWVRDKSDQHNLGGSSNAVTITLNIPPDSAAPTPSTMAWSVAPFATGSDSISMTAVDATDDSGVEYMFRCTAGGGHDSGWQDGTTYVDTGLAEGVTYTYTVQARDRSPAQNAGTASAPASTTTLNVAPTPSPMTFATPPTATNISTITMTATEATDYSGVEYYFACTAGGGHDSGWQNGVTYTDTGLTNNATYAYQVVARDKSLGKNQTAWSEPNSVTTPRYDCTPGMAADVDNNCMVDFADYAAFAAAWSQTPPTEERAVNGTFTDDIVPGWRQLDLPAATGTFYSWYDNTAGDPIGAAGIASDNTSEITSGHYLYQAIPVTAGMQYTLSAEWTGDLSVAGFDPANRTLWSKVLVFFEGSTDPNYWTSLGSPDSIAYGKSFGATTQNIGSSGIWGWEQVTASQVHGPADGLFTATAGYMVIALESGGLTGSEVGYYYIDNVSVTGPACPQHDLNGDCKLDWLDIQAFAAQWLDCSRIPAGECGI